MGYGNYKAWVWSLTLFKKEREIVYFVFPQGMKEQKLKAKQKRDEEIEAERQILDLEEEIYKQGERKKAMENAKQYQFFQTERVKSFHVLSSFSPVYKYVYLACIVNTFL